MRILLTTLILIIASQPLDVSASPTKKGKAGAEKTERKPFQSRQRVRSNLVEGQSAKQEIQRGRPAFDRHPTTTVGRWSLGSRSFGYDHLGYPDPYFLFPYSLDPWVRGSFRAPDLHDDPYFYDRAPTQTRRTSQTHTTAAELKDHPSTSTVNEVAQRTDREIQRLNRSVNGIQSDQTDGSSITNQASEPVALSERSTRILKSLTKSSSSLAESLLEYGGGDQWIEFLQPNMIPIMALRGQYEALNEILNRYDQTFTREDIRTVSQIQGFEASRNQLRKFLKSVRQEKDPK